MSLTPEGKVIWVDHYDRHRAKQIGLDADLAAAWSKLEAYAARFALIFQLCSWAAGEAGEDAVDHPSSFSHWFGNSGG